jgi:hypothetical protein
MTEEEIAAQVAALVRRELAAQKAKAEPDMSGMEAYRSDMHALRERNASVIPPWLHREVAGGVTDADAKDLVHASHAPKGPSGQGVIPSTQEVTRVSRSPGIPGSGTGWQHEIPLTRWRNQ